jgi:hypothetical protein
VGKPREEEENEQSERNGVNKDFHSITSLSHLAQVPVSSSIK